MSYAITTAVQKIYRLSKRIRAIQGGTSASKTISILLTLIDMAQTDKIPTVTSVVSESFPHLKRGAIRDFISIMEQQGYYHDARWNRSDFIYKFETGSVIEFFSADQPAKVRGPRRNRLFINEANNVPLETFEQLEVRTKDVIFLDWNPTNEFWFYDIGDGSAKGIKDRTDVDWIILTYKDNEALDQAIVDSIEQRMGRAGWWKVYGLGQLGEVEGKIYKDWELGLDKVPHEAKLMRYGLDFGYSNDPTSIVAIYEHNGGYILDQIAYAKGMSNADIAAVLKNCEPKLVIADSAEPKSIDEIRAHGITIRPADKGKDSVRKGIQLVQDQRISVTKQSVDVIREYRNYLWETDKDGKFLSPNEPQHQFSHSMDAIRYGLDSFVRPQKLEAHHFYPGVNLTTDKKNTEIILQGSIGSNQFVPSKAAVRYPHSIQRKR